MKYAVNVSWVAATLVCKSNAIAGNAGRYMSIANVPTAAKRPKTNAGTKDGPSTRIWNSTAQIIVQTNRPAPIHCLPGTHSRTAEPTSMMPVT